MQCQTILGRDTVDVQFRDDKYAPDSAIQACQELSASSLLLTAIGGGTDQIQACGTYAAQARVPYLSTGVTQNQLANNPWYFGMTMSYRPQGGLLAQYVAANPDHVAGLGTDAKIGTIITDAPNYDDALEGWLTGLSANDLQNLDTFKHATGDKGWYASTAQRFQQLGIEVVYILTSPVDYINFAKTAQDQFDYAPQYISIATDMALNAVLSSGCGGGLLAEDAPLDGGIFLSPTGGLDKAPADFFEASATMARPADDIALSLWAMAQAQHQLLDAYGEQYGDDLTREDLRDFIEGGDVTTTGVYPDATWSPGDHMGGDAMYVVQADCESKTHTTIQMQSTGF